MNSSTLFFRTIFAVLTIVFFTLFATKVMATGFTPTNAAFGAAIGLLFSLLIFSTDYFFKQMTLKSMNVASLGLFFGYLLGQSITLILTALADMAPLAISPEVLGPVKAGVFLFSVYFGITFISRASEELYVSVPFVKFKPSAQKKKDCILDQSILCDTRLIDLASSGLLDNHLVLPRFILKDIYEQAESDQENIQSKARRSLEVVKKLEELPELNLKIVNTNFPELKDLQSKLVRLARLLDAHLLTAEANQLELSSMEGIRIINMHSIAKALKPLTQTGEFISIKVQRYGKEARQGVGYLDDGTMVVINGGAEYIGESIKAQVLSVKHTSSGRMIFCNAIEDSESHPHDEEPLSSNEESIGAANSDASANKYFAL